MRDQLIIFDTTMRDGEQSPGAAMTRDDKVRIGKQLERLRVDVIEAGFAASSPGDFEAIRAVAAAVKDSTICSLARANDNDVKRAGEAVKGANRGRVHTFIATSHIHMKHKLRMEPDAVLEAAVRAVKLARQYTDDVEFSAEDAVRSDVDFLCRIFEATIAAGATTINVPDTVGYSVPDRWGDLFRTLMERIPNSGKAVWSTHCHNDLGMAVANSLAGVKIGGARQVECTINGLGERAGNASLEEIVMAVKTRSDVFKIDTGIDATQIVPASKLVSQITGYPVQPNKAVVGANAFAHESGIHQDGVIKHRETYEIMKASDVGWGANRLTLGKLSGRNAFKSRLQELGIALASEEQLNAAFARFKELADKKREIFDEDIQALMSDEAVTPDVEHYRLVSLSAHSETGEQPFSRVVMSDEGREMRAEARGGGIVDATFKAIESMVRSGTDLLLYSVNNVTEGTDSQGEVTVRLAKNGRIVNGMGSDTDIVVASAKAYINALNKMGAKSRMNPQYGAEAVAANGTL